MSKMGLKLTVKEGQEFTVGTIRVSLIKVRQSKCELTFVGPKEIPIIGPHMQKKLTKVIPPVSLPIKES